MGKHKHEPAYEGDEVRPFTGSLARRHLDNECQAAHGGVTVTEHCECGAWRYVNVNQRFREYGPWSDDGREQRLWDSGHRGPPDPGKCHCGHPGDWRLPMWGKAGGEPVYWPTCPFHRSNATGAPVPVAEYEALIRED